ncbi:MAG: BON domain-containing protein [Acidobacteria bacterium]|nr:BON domain-containing protein [Acidobacteriota bacterium]
MRTVGLVVAGLLGVGTLTYLCSTHHGPLFAADLSAKSAAAFRSAGIDGVQTAGEGQVITLTGQVGSEAVKAKAGRQVAAIWGVEEVRNPLTVAPHRPSRRRR